MREVILAESAGFCYGVKRAIEIAEKTAAEGPCYTLGALIHNKAETDRLETLGVSLAESIEEIPDGSTVIMRSHGSPIRDYEALKDKGCRIVDATCPNVSHIHGIVRKAEEEGRLPVVIGEESHPEVVAVLGQCSRAVVLSDEVSADNWIKSAEISSETPVTVVHQTTAIRENAKKCDEILKKEYTNLKIFDTICKATSRRQREAAKLAARCGAMIVIGDRSSANTKRLAEICAEHCEKVIFAESASGLDLSELDGVDSIGVTAGASAPAWIIKEAYNKMTEEIKTMETIPEEESFDALLEKSIKTLNTGEKVSGIVQHIGTTEVTVDLGTKHSGYIPMSELTDDPDLKPEDIVQVGAEIETYVMRVNDVEGTVMLSKKRLDTVKNWEYIEQAKEEKLTVEGTVTEENKGGVIVNVKGIRVFVPASQTGLAKDVPMSTIMKTRQQLRITEVNHSRRRVVGSIRAVQYEARKAAAEATWNEIEVGKKYTGTVKSLTSYGAFVDIGGVDGMVHVSELSWKRIKNPAEVVKVGDQIDVYVISFDKEAKKISLGYKQASENPWTIFTNKYEVGSVLTVKIVKLMAFGAFAEILPGVDGLIHVSQITNERRIGKPDEVLTEGQEVEVKITNIDFEKQKVSLSMRALMEAPAAPAEEENADELVYSTDEPAAEE
ncbi:MAG: bifunctional 4-hydroxy-3-methylbut-2-enyl diphosphate reductase/30S ribosomal protein S1 [Clostridiales bacterium]|nr:bifunctional 4-hydroxy-3-methylbut-2-enyl diphosphate reductase/30S ribosomal protein S1 [Clostridiales bacterium]